MLNYRFSLKNAFQEVLYMIDAWNNEGSGWIVESIESQNINKGLINIKNKDQKCFLWCHVSHINPSKEHLERIKKTDKKLLKNLIMMGLSFLCKKKI